MEIITLSYAFSCLIIVSLWPKIKKIRNKKSVASKDDRGNVFILVALIVIIIGVGLSAFVLQNGIGNRSWVGLAIDLKNVILGVVALIIKVFFETRSR